MVCSQRCQGLTLTSARVLGLSTFRWASLPTHRYIRPHNACAVRALMPILALHPPHVCHRQRQWAVSIGSHMQQDIDISEAPPHPGAPIPLFEYRSLLRTTIQKIGDNYSRDIVVFCRCFNASFPPRREAHVQNHAHMHIGSHPCGDGGKKKVGREPPAVERKKIGRATREVTVKRTNSENY